MLSVRGSTDEWFRSLVTFHSRLTADGVRVPTPADLKAFHYRRPGFLWRMHELIWGADEFTLYDRAIYGSFYERHNAAVRDYFRLRPESLLDVNLADADAGPRLARFLDLPADAVVVPHSQP